MNKQTAWVMIGILGSGKSTWARAMAADPTVSIVSRDDIRLMLNGVYKFIPALEPLVHRITESSIFNVLSCGRNLVVDECHISITSRSGVVNFIRKNFPNVRIVGVWCPGVVDNVKRRMMSPKGQPEGTWIKVWRSMVDRFEDPAPSEFDELIVVNEELK